MASPGKKGFQLSQIVYDRRRRQRRNKATPIAFGPEAWVKHGHDAAIPAVADQTAETLLQREDGQRHLVLRERIAASRAYGVDTRRRDRVAGRSERELVHDDAAQGIAHDIHSLPEARGGEKHRVRRISKLLQ